MEVELFYKKIIKIADQVKKLLLIKIYVPHVMSNVSLSPLCGAVSVPTRRHPVIGTLAVHSVLRELRSKRDVTNNY